MLPVLELELESRPLEELGELLAERARLLEGLAAGAPTVELLAQLEGHRAAGERIVSRIRGERAAMVAEWNELSHERRVRQVFAGAGADAAGQLLELG